MNELIKFMDQIMVQKNSAVTIAGVFYFEPRRHKGTKLHKVICVSSYCLRDFVAKQIQTETLPLMEIYDRRH